MSRLLGGDELCKGLPRGSPAEVLLQVDSAAPGRRAPAAGRLVGWGAGRRAKEEEGLGGVFCSSKGVGLLLLRFESLRGFPTNSLVGGGGRSSARERCFYLALSQHPATTAFILLS